MSAAWDPELCGAPLAGITWAEQAEAGVGDRVIAPEGQGAWRHMAWPVADELFELDAAPLGAPAVVTGGSPDDRAATAAALEALDAGARVEPVLTLDALHDATIVVLLGGSDALPPLVFVPLAARRLVVTPRRRRTFGLHLGIEVQAADVPATLAERANAALHHPDAFETARTFGALAAERQRASALNARLAVDLALAHAREGV